MKKQLFEGKFEIQGEIAKGQTGTIYYGYDMELRQEVAIKVYHSHINGRLIRGKAFIEKSKPLLLIDHPNLIKIFKVEEEDDTPVVFMEFFDAPSLQQMIHDKSPLPVQDMLILAREIAEVLVHTHFQGIIHGTLHPGHVLVGPQGQVKVMDLGLSWILMDILSNCDGELLRPLPYLPPEIAKGELLNVSSDLYCLGFMMYEMLTGSVPYAGLPKTSIMGKLAFDQTDPVFDFPGTVPEAICDLIRHMTRNKIQQRLQDTTHVLTIINQQLAKLPLSEESTFSPPKSPQPQTPTPKEPPQPEKTPAITAPSTTTPEPTLKKTPAFQRPHTSINYRRVHNTKMLRKIGITLGLVSLIGVAGTLGFWYRDLLEPQISVFQTQLDTPSQATSLPQKTHLEDETSITPDNHSSQSQEPLLETENLLQDKPQSVPTKEEIEPGSQSNLAQLSAESDIKPNKPDSTQPPHSPKTKQGSALASTKKQSDATSSPTPSTPQPAVSISADVKNAPLPPKASKKNPPQQPTSQPPQASKSQQGKALTPNKKPSDVTSSSATNTPQPAASTPDDSKNAPLPPKTSKKVSPQQSRSLIPTKETSHPETESAQSVTPSEEIHDKLTAEEIEELLQSVDDPAIDLSSISEP